MSFNVQTWLDYYGFMFLSKSHTNQPQFAFLRFAKPRLLPKGMPRWVVQAIFGLAPFAVSGAVAQAVTGQLSPISAATAPRGETALIENSALDTPLFYQLILGELNAQSGEPGVGFSLILDAARKTASPKLYERAVEVAIQARSGDAALQAARAWKLAFPGSREANGWILQILTGLNRVGETLEPLKSEITNAAPVDRGAAIAGIPRYYARTTDKLLATTVVEQVLADYMASPQLGAVAWTVVGQMRANSGNASGALDAAARAQQLDVTSEGPAQIALSLVQAKTPLAEQIVRKHLEGKAGGETRMDFARVLLDAQRYTDAAAQLQILTAQHPNHMQAWLVKGALEIQDKKLDFAEVSLKRHIELVTAGPTNRTAEGSRSLAQAYLSLAQISELRKDFAQAEKWLAQIENSDDMIGAQSRRAAILAKQGRLEEGRKLLKGLPEKSPAEARAKIVAEVQFLRDNKQFQSAYTLLFEKNAQSPIDHELLYEQATLAEKLGQLDEMERILRAIMASKPDYQHAYNALGYSLAERKVRLPEARQLILKALELAPDDPFITDSLGWVEFQSGNLPEALRILQNAFKSKPDAEIAAHLGEVLWVSGKREQALVIWREGVALNSESETLVETLKRLRVKP